MKASNVAQEAIELLLLYLLLMEEATNFCESPILAKTKKVRKLQKEIFYLSLKS